MTQDQDRIDAMERICAGMTTAELRDAPFTYQSLLQIVQRREDRKSHPDFRPQLSKLHQAVEAYEKAFDTGYSDKEWSAVLDANHEAWIELCKDAHDAAVRAEEKKK